MDKKKLAIIGVSFISGALLPSLIKGVCTSQLNINVHKEEAPIVKSTTVLKDVKEQEYIKNSKLEFAEDQENELTYTAHSGIEGVFDVGVIRDEHLGESVSFYIVEMEDVINTKDVSTPSVQYCISNMNDKFKYELEVAIRSLGATKDETDQIFAALDRELGCIVEMVDLDKGRGARNLNYEIKNLFTKNGFCISTRFDVPSNELSKMSMYIDIDKAYETDKTKHLLSSGLDFKINYDGYSLYDLKNKINMDLTENEVLISIKDDNMDNEVVDKQITLLIEQFDDSKEELLEFMKSLKSELKDINNLDFDDTGCYEVVSEKVIGEYIVSVVANDEDYHGMPSIDILISKK